MDLIKPFRAIRLKKAFESTNDELNIETGLNFDKNFSQDEKPNFYIYQYQDDDLTTLGLIALVSLKNIANKKILKHEKVYADKVERQKEFFLESLFQNNPVLLIHNPKESIKHLIKNITLDKPANNSLIYKGQSTHKLWAINDEVLQKCFITLYNSISRIYIADGHHRIAALEELYKKNAISDNYFLACLVAETEIRVETYAKLFKKMINYEAIKNSIDINFQLTKYTKKKNHTEDCIGFIWLQQQWYLIKTKNKKQNSNNSTWVTTGYVDSFKFLYYKHMDENFYSIHVKTFLELQEHIRKTNVDLAIYFKPINFSNIHTALKKGLLLQPNATYIKPKLPDGFFNYYLSEDNL